MVSRNREVKKPVLIASRAPRFSRRGMRVPAVSNGHGINWETPALGIQSDTQTGSINTGTPCSSTPWGSQPASPLPGVSVGCDAGEGQPWLHQHIVAWHKRRQQAGRNPPSSRVFEAPDPVLVGRAGDSAAAFPSRLLLPVVPTLLGFISRDSSSSTIR